MHSYPVAHLEVGKRAEGIICLPKFSSVSNKFLKNIFIILSKIQSVTHKEAYSLFNLFL